MWDVAKATNLVWSVLIDSVYIIIWHVAFLIAREKTLIEQQKRFPGGVNTNIPELYRRKEQSNQALVIEIVIASTWAR